MNSITQKFTNTFLNRYDCVAAAAAGGALALGASIPAVIGAAGLYIAMRIGSAQKSKAIAPKAIEQPPEKPAPQEMTPSLKKIPMSPPPETLGTAPLKYLAAALLVGAFAAGIFCICPPAGIVLAAIAGWLLWSSCILCVNYAVKDSDSSFAKTIRAMHAFTFEINAAAGCTILAPATFFDRFHAPSVNLGGRPILMINGYLSFGSTWYYQRKQLEKAGLGPVYTMNIGSFDSIEKYAEQVQKTVKKIQEDTGRKDLALVCHSKGGLVGSYYATKLAAGDGAEITDVVTIGSPLGGTPVAYLGPGRDAKQMNPDHPFNVDLRQAIKDHPEIRFYNIASVTDEVVPVGSAIQEQDPAYTKVYKDLGHLALVFSKKVAIQVCCFLKE